MSTISNPSIENRLFKTPQLADQFISLMQQIASDQGSKKENNHNLYLETIQEFFTDLFNFYTFPDIPSIDSVPGEDIGYLGNMGMDGDGNVWLKDVTGWRIYYAHSALACNYQELTANATVAVSFTIFANAAAGGFTITLPPNPVACDSIKIMKDGSFGNHVLIDGNGNNIRDEGIFKMNTPHESNEFVFNGTYWGVF